MWGRGAGERGDVFLLVSEESSVKLGEKVWFDNCVIESVYCMKWMYLKYIVNCGTHVLLEVFYMKYTK